MIEQPIGQNHSKVVNVLIFIFPIVIISLQVAGDIILFILAMMGIFTSISQKLSPFVIKEIKVFSYLTIGYFTAVCLSVVFSGQADELAHYIPRDLYFLFAPFIALTLYKTEINIKFLIVGAKVSLLVLGAIIIVQISSEISPLDRPSGVINPNVFGNLSVSLFFIALVFFQEKSFKYKIFSSLSLLSGFFIIVVSGSRGAWLSFMFLLAAYSYFSYKKRAKLHIRFKIIIVLIVAFALSIANSSQLIHDRISIANTEISKWASGDISPTSVGQRMVMYKKAIDNIEDVPFFGHGLRYSNIALFKNDSSAISKLAAEYNHLHNAYLTNYYNGGIPLLGALLLLLFIPLRIFLKANRLKREDPVFISGALLTLGYVSYGMVNILLGDTYMNGFYTFYLAILMVLHAKSIKAR